MSGAIDQYLPLAAPVVLAWLAVWVGLRILTTARDLFGAPKPNRSLVRLLGMAIGSGAYLELLGHAPGGVEVVIAIIVGGTSFVAWDLALSIVRLRYPDLYAAMKGARRRHRTDDEPDDSDHTWFRPYNDC